MSILKPQSRLHNRPAGVVASAIVDGEPATSPIIINDRPYTLRVRVSGSKPRFPEAMSNTILVNSNGGLRPLISVHDRGTSWPDRVLRDNCNRKRKLQRDRRCGTWELELRRKKAVADMHFAAHYSSELRWILQNAGQHETFTLFRFWPSS